MNLRNARIAVPLLVALSALLVYANAIGNGFALDDTAIIQGNPRVHQLADQAAIWLTPYWPTFGEMLGLYRPLAIFLYAVQWALGDGAPWLFHAVSALLHAGVSVLVALLAAALVAPTLEERSYGAPALVAGLVFAVHPVHTEAVANVVGQAEIVAAGGVLLGCLLYVGRPRDGTMAPGRLIAITLCYALAMLAKEHAIVLPALLVALDLAQGRLIYTRADLTTWLRRSLLLLAALAVAAVAFLLMRHLVLGSIIGSDANPGLPYLREQGRFLTALRAWPEFYRLLFFPANLSSDYAPAVVLPVSSLSPMVWLGGLLLFATVVLAIATPVMPGPGLAAAWFFIVILPVANLLFPVGVLVAERTLYLPSVSVALLAAYAARAVQVGFDPRRRRIAVLAAVAALVAMAVRTVARNPTWDSTRAVWIALAEDHPESYRAQWGLASIFTSAGDTARARFHWELGLRIYPRDSQFLADYAAFEFNRANYDAAIELLERSRTMIDFVPRTELLYARALYAVGRHGESLAAYDRTAAMPEARGLDSGDSRAFRATLLERLGRQQQALDDWRAAIAAPGPNRWLHAASLARALARLDRRDEARTIVDAARAWAPEDARAANTLAAVRRAIEDCYGAAQPCDDPLDDWVLFRTRSENASALQNARTPGEPDPRPVP